MFASGWAVLVAVVGVVLVVAAVLLGRRWGGRRSVGVAGAGLLLLGLALSGIVGILVRLSLNPVAWLGLAAAGVGLVMLSSAGMLPRRGSRAAAGPDELGSGSAGASSRRSVARGAAKPPKEPKQGPRRQVDDDMAEIEEILKRRGIS